MPILAHRPEIETAIANVYAAREAPDAVLAPWTNSTMILMR